MENLVKNIVEVVENSIKNFSSKISDKYELDKEEVFSLWDKKLVNLETENKSNIEINNETLLKANKKELEALCRKNKLKVTGKKEVLIKRLLDFQNEKKSEKTTILDKISETVPIIQIRKNEHGNYEHPDTKLIFCKNEKKVIGKQKDDGTISNLTKDDINNCNKFKFKYILPDNLNNNDNSKVDIEELSEEELSEEELSEECFSEEDSDYEEDSE